MEVARGTYSEHKFIQRTPHGDGAAPGEVGSANLTSQCRGQGPRALPGAAAGQCLPPDSAPLPSFRFTNEETETQSREVTQLKPQGRTAAGGARACCPSDQPLAGSASLGPSLGGGGLVAGPCTRVEERGKVRLPSPPSLPHHWNQDRPCQRRPAPSCGPSPSLSPEGPGTQSLWHPPQPSS